MGEAARSRTEEPRDGRSVDPSAREPLRTFAASRLGFLARIISNFLVEAPGLIAEMKAAAATGDRERLGRAANMLKTGAATVGASRLSVLCAEIHDALGAPSAPGRLIVPIATEHDRVAEILAGIVAQGEMSDAPR